MTAAPPTEPTTARSDPSAVPPDRAAEAIARARTVADELRAGADAVDTGETPVDVNYQRIRESGLLAILVPPHAGGFGLSFLDYTRVLEELALGDAATALGFTMHNVALGSLCDTARTDATVGPTLTGRAREFRDRVFAEVVDRRRLFASATSEFGAGARLTRLTTSYTADDAGFVLTGSKSFVSLAGIADHYVVAAVPVEEAEAEGDVMEVSHFLVGRDDPGVSFGGVWDGAALRGTETATMRLDDVRVDRDRLFLGVEGMSLFKVVREPHWMAAGYLGAYLGIAESILRYATETVAEDAERHESPMVRSGLGRMATHVAAARALAHHAASLVDRSRGSREANAAVHAAKYVVGELAPRLALDAVRLCGSGSLRRSRPLERLLRESTFCSVMPAKPDDCLDFVGRAQLGDDLSRADTSPW